MLRGDHYDVNRSRGNVANGKKRMVDSAYTGMMADDYAYVPGGGGGGSSGSAMGRKQDHSLKDPSQRHPNQYTKKRAQAQGGGGSAMMGFGSAVPSAMSGAGGSLYPPIPSHPLGMTAIDAVKEKRRGGEPSAPAMSQNGNSSRAGSVVGGNGGGQHMYGAGGMASQDEYNLATLGGGGSQRGASKRKVEESSGASKRRKKGYVYHYLQERLVIRRTRKGN